MPEKPPTPQLANKGPRSGQVLPIGPEETEAFIEFAIRTFLALQPAQPISRQAKRLKAFFALVRIWEPTPNPRLVERGDDLETVSHTARMAALKQSRLDGTVPAKTYFAVMELASGLQEQTEHSAAQGAPRGAQVDWNNDALARLLPKLAEIYKTAILPARREKKSAGAMKSYSSDEHQVDQNIGVGKEGQSAKELHIEWNGRSSDVSAIEHFEELFGQLDYDSRPTADVIYRSNRKYYNALARHQSRKGGSMGDLFPIDSSAKGGGREKLIKAQSQDPELAKTALLARQASDRRRQAARRARLRRQDQKPS